MIEEVFEHQKTSKYNSGIAQIYRLDEIWKRVNNYSVNGKFEQWNLNLDRIWSELSKDLKETDFKSKQTEFSNFDIELLKLMPFNDNAGDSFKPLTKEDIDKRSKQYNILMGKELFLRRLENFVGKGTAWDDDEDDF